MTRVAGGALRQSHIFHHDKEDFCPVFAMHKCEIHTSARKSQCEIILYCQLLLCWESLMFCAGNLMLYKQKTKQSYLKSFNQSAQRLLVLRECVNRGGPHSHPRPWQDSSRSLGRFLQALGRAPGKIPASPWEVPWPLQEDSP